MYIGQQVICVDFDDSDLEASKYGTECPYLREGAVYTIRDIDYRTKRFYGFPVVRLEEIIHDLKNGFEPGYHPSAFRPLSPTSIEVFTSMVRETEKHLEGVVL